MDINEGDIDIAELDIQWCDSNTFIQIQDKLVPAGTCLKINNTILFLNCYKTSDLEKLRFVVNSAIENEINKRSVNS